MTQAFFTVSLSLTQVLFWKKSQKRLTCHFSQDTIKLFCQLYTKEVRLTCYQVSRPSKAFPLSKKFMGTTKFGWSDKKGSLLPHSEKEMRLTHGSTPKRSKFNLSI